MPRKAQELNRREKSILKFIEKKIKEDGYPPSVREIGKAVGLSSTATVHGYLAKLREKGYIKKEDKKGRTLKLLKGGNGEPVDNTPKNFYSEKELIDYQIAKYISFLKNEFNIKEKELSKIRLYNFLKPAEKLSAREYIDFVTSGKSIKK